MNYRRPDIYEMLDTLTIQELKDLRNYLEKQIEEEERQPEKSYLEEQWDEIHRLMRSLDYEPYLDDQIEISMIWDICEELLQSGSLKEEPWDARKKILTEIIENAYYEEYSVYDPIHDLFLGLAVTLEEKLWCADAIFKISPSFIHEDGASIYKENGKPEKYYEYLETKLAKDSVPYVELIRYFEDTDPDKAISIAQRAMKHCTNDLTDIVIFLLVEAMKKHDEETYSKWMKSAKLRRTINYDKVLTALNDIQVSDKKSL